jgi:hypothetical protein
VTKSVTQIKSVTKSVTQTKSVTKSITQTVQRPVEVPVQVVETPYDDDDDRSVISAIGIMGWHQVWLLQLR